MRSQPERLAYSISDLATALGIARSTAERWVYRGLVPSAKISGRRFIPADAVQALIHTPCESKGLPRKVT